MSENSASTRTSGANATPVPAPPPAGQEIDDQTHRKNPMPSSSPGAAVSGAPAAASGTAASSAATPATGAGTAGTTGTGASPVKDGAVKAAAAALAAAKSAAKKVQSVIPEPAARPEGESAGAAPARGAAPAGTQEPRPEMHYSGGGVPPGATAGIGVAGAQGLVREAGPRRVRLSVSRVDPWSVMKLAFLLSVAIGFMTVVATMVVWYVLNDMGTFHTVQDFLQETVGPQTVNIVQFIEFDRVVSLSVLIAIVNVVLLTAIATIMAILYNITAALVGGVHLTLTDE